MTSRLVILTLAATSVLFAGSVLAGEIYKYTDADGTVSYVDRPTTDPDRVHMSITSRSTDNAAIQANTQARLSAANAASAAEATAKEADGVEELTRSERRAAASARQQQCDMYRTHSDTIEGARRLSREDENGDRTVLTDEEVQAARNKARELIQENCD